MNNEEVEKNIPQEIPSNISTAVSKTFKFPLKKFLIAFLLVTFSFIIYTIFNAKNVDKVNPVVKENPLMSKILTRSHIKDQKNIIQNSGIASGFLSPAIFSQKTSSKNYFNAFAQENSEELYLFYILNRTKAVAFNTITGKANTLFSLNDIPGISIKNGTYIGQVYFLNRSKKIVFFLQERLDNYPSDDETVRKNLMKFRKSVKIYDVKTKKFTEIISSEGIGNWFGPSISPDENYVFILFNNVGEKDAFADVPAVPNSGYAKYSTYFFYDLKSNTLKKFKLNLLPSGSGGEIISWSQNSSSVFLNYVMLELPLFHWPAPAKFVSIFPDGHFENVLEKKTPIIAFSQGLYLKDLKKIFYIAQETNNDAESKFSYYDESSQAFNTITPVGSNSQSFVYDYTNGFIYDSFKSVMYDSHIGGIENRVLNYYDLKTNQSREISDQNLGIINFNGDYEHLLVSSYYTNKISKLYDLDIKTGKLTFLNYAPIVFSVWGDSVLTSDTSIDNISFTPSPSGIEPSTTFIPTVPLTQTPNNSPTSLPSSPTSITTPTRKPNPPTGGISWPSEGQTVNSDKEELCFVDAGTGGDLTGVMRSINVNNGGWGTYIPVYPTSSTCFFPKEGENTFSVKLKNQYGEESEIYTRDFIFHKI